MKTKSCLAPVVGQQIFFQKSPLRKGFAVRNVSFGCGPLTVTVTTKIIITFFIGNPYKPSFTTVTVRGPHPTYRFLGALKAPRLLKRLENQKSLSSAEMNLMNIEIGCFHFYSTVLIIYSMVL